MFVCTFYLFIYSSTRTLERHSYKISYAQEVESGFGGGNKNYQGVSFSIRKVHIYVINPKLIFFCLAVSDTA